jgi:hypothetical protein
VSKADQTLILPTALAYIDLWNDLFIIGVREMILAIQPSATLSVFIWIAVNGEWCLFRCWRGEGEKRIDLDNLFLADSTVIYFTLLCSRERDTVFEDERKERNWS